MHTEVIPWDSEMFSGIVVDTEGTILGLEGEVSGCGVLPVEKIRNPESDYSVNSFYCISLQIQTVCISEDLWKLFLIE